MLKCKIKLVLIGFKSLYWELSKLYKILDFLNSQYNDSKFTVQLLSKIIPFLIVKIRLNKLCTNIGGLSTLMVSLPHLKEFSCTIDHWKLNIGWAWHKAKLDKIHKISMAVSFGIRRHYCLQ